MKGSQNTNGSHSPEKCLEQAQFYFKQGKLVEARDWLQRMLEIAPDELQAIVAYGNLSFQFGEMFAAADAFEKAVKLRPNDASLHALLATAAYRSGRVEVFKTALARALELDDKNAAALQLLANLNLSQGNLAGASKIYFKILKHDESNVEATFGLGVCFFNQSNKSMARQSFERVLKLQPNHGLALENLLALQMGESPAGAPDTRRTLLVNNYNYNACSAGVRALHYLATLLRAAGVPVAVTHRCFYNPTIPIRSQAMPDDIVIYPDASRGNTLNAERIVRYMFYYAHAYYGGDRISKEECAIVFHRNYLEDVQAHCDYPLSENDIFTIPILDKEWCFSEEKTIENVLYVGKGKDRALPNIDYLQIAPATASQNHNGPLSDHYAHMRTLSVLRKAKNFYTMDENTLMSSEAALCGCKVFFVKDANTFEEQPRILEEFALPQVMAPGQDIQRARKIAERIYHFFEARQAEQRSVRNHAQIPAAVSAPVPALPPKTPPAEKSEVSIIIPTFNKLELTRQCLRALRANTPAPRHEIIVVDNGSTDGTREFLQAEESAGNLRAILNTDNAGFANACNQGARAAQGRYITFLNNDTEPQNNWLGPLFSLAEGDSTIAVCGAKLLYPNGTIQHAGVALADCWDHDPLLAFHLFAKEKADFPLANQRRVYQAVTAACMLVRKTCFDEVSGFDEKYWNGYEDVDLCLRFQQRGWLSVYEPGSVVIHHESQSGPERFRRVSENIELFHRKWLEQASPDVIIDQSGKTRISEGSVMRMYSPPPGKLVSIIILAHNQLTDTRQCVASVEKHTPLSHELILVDNGSTDGTGQFFRQYAAKRENVRVILNRANLGFSAGNNQALACAKGDFILLLNNDTVVTPGWLEQMLSVLELYPDCGLTGPMSNSVSGPQLVSSANYGSLEELPKFANQWSGAHAGQSTEAPRLVGFCLLLRRLVLEKIGGLDAQFGNGNFEDDDFCIRALLSGFKLRIAHASFVHHTGGQTFKGAKMDYRASMSQNWEIFKAKWGMPKDAPLGNGYRIPSAAPSTTPLRLPLPALANSHVSSSEGRCWTDKTLPEAVLKKSPQKAASISLPPSALIGNLNRARDLAGKKQFAAAWESTTAAILARPYHPEAYLLLAEIALRGGAGESARQSAQRARDMAPDWAPPKKFLKGHLRGNTSHEWLKIPAATNSPRISVCLITKDEEKFIGRCLRSVQSIACQIIVMDTGSTDRTVEIAREHGAEVHSFAWCDDFAAARNAALEHATGDWILVLDADEELMAREAETLSREIRTPAVLGYRIPIIDAGREKEGCSYVPRLFRNAPGLFFVGRIHEQAFSSIQVRCQQWGLKHQIGATRLLHHGYTDEVLEKRGKIERNLRLLRQAIEELPGEPNLVMSLGLELVRSGEFDAGIDRYWEAFHLLAALPASQVTPELKETLLTQLTTHLMAGKRYSEVAQLWQIPFAKSGGMTASQHFSLGLAYIELKQPAQAAEQMRQCLARRNQPTLTPVNREILKAAPNHCLALCLAATNQPEAARQAFEGALADDPLSRVVRFDFARFHAAQGASIDALKLLNQLALENPGEARVWQFGGQIALSRPECLDFSRHWTAQAIKHFPQDHSIAIQRAEVLMLNQDIERALPLWRIADAPASPRHRAAIVLCELLLGDRQHQFRSDEEPAISREAVQWYRQWISVGAHSLLHGLHERIEQIRLVLPAFVNIWEAADRQARKVAA
jgi:GT2 family glycosyltransferase/Tfp pilus assembly protein PilF